MKSLLSEGQTIKNYKELCRILNIKQKGGDSKKAQLKELACHCRYSRDGHSFIIDQIYDEPLPNNDGRGKSEGSRRNNKLYDNLIQWLLLDLLAQEQNNGKLFISKSELLRSIDMTNSNYSYLMDYQENIGKYIEADKVIVFDFYKTNNNHFSRIINSTLKELADKRIIDYYTVKMVKRKYTNKHEPANDEDMDIILKIEKDILEEMGFGKDSEMLRSGKFHAYWKTVNRTISEVSNIEYYYSSFEIFINQYYIDTELNSLLDLLLNNAKREEFRADLNKRVMKHLLDNAKRRHKTELEKENWNPFDSDPYRISKDYVNKIEQLINLLIDRKTPNISHDIKRIKVK